MTILLGVVYSISLLSAAAAQTYSATYLPSNAPDQSEAGQSGTNRCVNGLNQTSNCQNAYRKWVRSNAREPIIFTARAVNSVTDWCIWSPPEPGPGSVIGNTEVRVKADLRTTYPTLSLAHRSGLVHQGDGFIVHHYPKYLSDRGGQSEQHWSTPDP